jgi:hypothetical protein
VDVGCLLCIDVLVLGVVREDEDDGEALTFDEYMARKNERLRLARLAILQKKVNSHFFLYQCLRRGTRVVWPGGGSGCMCSLVAVYCWFMLCRCKCFSRAQGDPKLEAEGGGVG